MKGTEKQIKWAEDIKDEAMGTIEANITRLEKLTAQCPNRWLLLEKELFESLQKQIGDFFASTEEASKVIDARNRLSGSFLLEMVNDEVIRQQNKAL